MPQLSRFVGTMGLSVWGLLIGKRGGARREQTRERSPGRWLKWRVSFAPDGGVFSEIFSGLAVCSPALRRVVQIGLLTGFRRQELAALRPDDVDMQHGTVSVASLL